MANLYDAIDVGWSWNGDLELQDGDIYVTLDDTLRPLVDQIGIICRSALGDWAIYPNKGAGLDDFVGEPNNRTTGEAIHDTLRAALVSSNVVFEEDLQIRVIPVHIHRVLVIIRVNAIATPYSRLRDGEPLVVSLIFDTAERQVFFLDHAPGM